MKFTVKKVIIPIRLRQQPVPMLCYVMLCYVMLCYVMLCYVILCILYVKPTHNNSL